MSLSSRSPGALKDALPADAIVGRVAGDEFAVTFTAGPEIDAETVLRACNRR